MKIKLMICGVFLLSILIDICRWFVKEVKELLKDGDDGAGTAWSGWG